MNELTIEEENAPQRLILTITAKPTEAPPADGQPLVSTYTVPVSIHAEAVVGRDLRFGAAPAEPGGTRMTARFHSSRRPIRRRTRPRRNGLMIVAALVCLLIVTSIVGSMLQGALRARRQLHAERNRRQAELLLRPAQTERRRDWPPNRNSAATLGICPRKSFVGLGAGRVTTEVRP